MPLATHNHALFRQLISKLLPQRSGVIFRQVNINAY